MSPISEGASFSINTNTRIHSCTVITSITCIRSNLNIFLCQLQSVPSSCNAHKWSRQEGVLIPVYPTFDFSRIALFLLSCNLTKQQQIASRMLSVVVCATVEYILPLHILAVIYLLCMKLCLAKGIIIPFAYNSSESGFGHISHRNLIWLIIVFVVLCSHLFTAALL